MELDQLHLPRLREAPALVELLAREIHEVLVDDVADVLEITDEGDQRDLLLGEIRAHGLTPEPGQEELDLALEVVELVVAPLHVLDVVADEDWMIAVTSAPDPTAARRVLVMLVKS